MNVFVDNEEITVSKEVCETDQAIHATFSVNKSGKYSVFLTYGGFAVCGSPFIGI